MRFDLTDDEWGLLQPPMPQERKDAREDDRRIVNARSSTPCGQTRLGAMCRSAMARIPRVQQL
jgi:hypothetical protein